ncbi:hypothetical protein [Rhizobium gallicum]|uniref:hypothetical protein n=1 Tax=Rhizobium gallicum TaxID=56730 RepID=UPI001EF7FCD7|nr:hypothetical protein [Rhizobium gallicum]ULJ75858.1 hypothetical protein L2W42_25485 [Rhizobium gallicum]
MKAILKVFRIELARIFSLKPAFAVLVIASVAYATFYRQPFLHAVSTLLPSTFSQMGASIGDVSQPFLTLWALAVAYTTIAILLESRGKQGVVALRYALRSCGRIRGSGQGQDGIVAP